MRGVGLIEFILVIGLVAIAAFIYVPYLRSFQKANDNTVSVEIITQAIKRAQARALATEEDSDWGVKIEASRAVVFKGSSFAGHDPKADEIYKIPQMAISGSSEIVFEKLSGRLRLGPGQSVSSISVGSQTLSVDAYGPVQSQ